MTIEQHIKAQLEARQNNSLYRQLKTEMPSIDFCSNDYLGFARDKVLKQKINDAQILTDAIKTGATGSRLLSGNYPEIENLENYLADYYKAPSALIFNSGYTANIGLLSCIVGRDAVVLYDELCHASIKDGLRLSLGKHFSFKHNNLNHLVEKLKLHQQSGNFFFVVVESVYSMDGDFSPLLDLVALSKTYNFFLIVDEAHAVGNFGENGEGLSVQLGVETDIFARVVTFGKALGQHGAAVLGSNDLKNYLINFSRPFIYTTALPPHSVISIKVAHDYLKLSVPIRESLFGLIQYFREKIQTFKHQPYCFLDSQSAIQGIVIGDNQKTIALAKKLQANNLDIRPILSPTVPIGSERLRICLHAFNTKNEIDTIFETLF